MNSVTQDAPHPLHTPELRGLRLTVADPPVTTSLLTRVLGLPIKPNDGAPRLRLGDHWLEPHAGSGDAVALACEDLAHQRLHLSRLGIAPLDGSALGCTPCLRLESVDTGGCSVDLIEATRPAASKSPSWPRLCGIELMVRTPERVAVHWAQLFHAQPLRNIDGTPSVRLGKVQVRFVAPDGPPRINAIVIETEDLDTSTRRAVAEDIEVRPSHEATSFMTQGLCVELRQKPPV